MGPGAPTSINSSLRTLSGTRLTPFSTNQNKFKICRNILYEGSRPEIDLVSLKDEELGVLMVHCWSEDPRERPEIGNIRQETMFSN